MKISKRFAVGLKIKILSIISLIAFFASVICSTKEQKLQSSRLVLNKYLEYSQYTDPGEFEDLYSELPESIEEICNLIKKQFIHPFDIKKFGDKIPKDRVYEDRIFPTVDIRIQINIINNITLV